MVLDDIQKLFGVQGHTWKQKFDISFASRALTVSSKEFTPLSRVEDVRIAQKNDARANLVLFFLSDLMVCGVETTSGMWAFLHILFLRRTLWHTFNSRRRIYRMIMDVRKHVIQYINRAKRLPTDSKAFNADVHYQKLAETILWQLIEAEHLTVAIGAMPDDENLTLHHLKSCLPQEKQRAFDRKFAQKKPRLYATCTIWTNVTLHGRFVLAHTVEKGSKQSQGVGRNILFYRQFKKVSQATKSRLTPKKHLPTATMFRVLLQENHRHLEEPLAVWLRPEQSHIPATT